MGFTHDYPTETTEGFDLDAYRDALSRDLLNLAESSLLHIWSDNNLDHMRLPTHVDIYTFLMMTVRQLFFRWLLLIGTNKGQPVDDIDPENYRSFYKMMTIREYLIYVEFLQNQLFGPTIEEIRVELGKTQSDDRSALIDKIQQAENMYDLAGDEQRRTWENHFYKAFQEYIKRNGYAAENILYTPAYPDIVLSSTGSGVTGVTNSSPQVKIPPIIAYSIRKSAPATSDKIPFGPNKDWKYNDAGEFFDTERNNVYQLKVQRWESLVEYTAIWRSGIEAEALCILFEQFMDLNERYFLKAGIEKIVPFGRSGEPDVRLDHGGVHYRKFLWHIKTQKFKYFGPVRRIESVEADVIPTS